MNRYENANIGEWEDGNGAICSECLITSMDRTNTIIEGLDGWEIAENPRVVFKKLPEQAQDLCWSCCQMIDENED